MMKKSYVFFAILSLAALLMTNDASLARGHRGGGCGGGGGGGCGYSYGGCCYSYGGCGYYGGCCYDSCCYSYGGCGYGGCGYSYGGCGYGGGYAQYATAPSTDVAYRNANSVVPSTAAIVRVILPDSQANVWVDGNRTTSTGAVRVYQTPGLTTGGTYQIKVAYKVGGREVTTEQSVMVTSGQTSVVDFNQTQSGTEVATRTMSTIPAQE